MQPPFDLIIRNATIIDGARTPRFAGDIGVRDGRIAQVGRLDGERAESEIDASGKKSPRLDSSTRIPTTTAS